MPRHRPTAILVLAVLHFIFGGLGLFCGVCSGVVELVGGPQGQQSQQARKEITEQVLSRKIPLYRAYTLSNRVSSLLSSCLLIAAGIGLLAMRSWGRWLSVVYAVLSIVMNLIGFVYTITFFSPAYDEVFQRLPPQSDQERLASDIARVVGPVGPCLMMIYPAVVLIIMLLPSTAAAFRARKKRRRLYREEDEWSN